MIRLATTLAALGAAAGIAFFGAGAASAAEPQSHARGGGGDQSCVDNDQNGLIQIPLNLLNFVECNQGGGHGHGH
ncbi:hypothetical protein [Actinomadura yumaensis]|uniref:DUF320 domain-containing protein n=1 Tax=Actinomadura yumaensis TaxID=111807 RepID=A0ABW2CI89_9ACTN